MIEIRLTLNGVPLPWKAPLKGTHGFYSPRHAVNKILIEELKAQYSGEVLTNPFICDLIFYLPLPKSISEKKRKLMLSGELRPQAQGDRTNLAKAYEDLLQGIVIKNDKQIVGGKVEKWYGNEPRTEYVLRSWEGINVE